ncbi:MAG TPA: PatB family C-S lyase [Gallionellaceae bacterium]|nr:PatB family C-S lyase [Gallionellaceae bacterium]
MSFDFDRVIPREGTASFKYDGRQQFIGRADVIPLWVADMDFAAPDGVTQALAQRAAHPIYGYSVYPESLYQSLMDWQRTRYGWEVPREQIVFCPGVVPSLHAAMLALCAPGEGVIVQPPVYPPFLAAPEITGRTRVDNPLRFEAGRYFLDLDQLERCAAQGARLLLLCTPHNPVGRVWERAELEALLDVCARHDVTIVSDEIHADLTYPGVTHLPLADLARGRVNVITAVAPSKTFNIPGLGLSALVVPEAAQRAAIEKVFGLLHVSATNPFSITAFEAAYRTGAPWLAALQAYLAGTRALVRDFLDAQLPQIRLIEPEGTYLLWLDCREMGLDDAQLKDFFVQQAGVGLSPGILFGPQGSGYMRMNIGAPRALIQEALERIARAWKLRA